ncbi:hypothetical protein L1887_10443 [Cichorium endivia]|nr:hypothetical protein L1887_10443 [Cichorium endivia]
MPTSDLMISYKRACKKIASTFGGKLQGEDTRKTFVDHLHSALHQKGILTFKDDEKLERGKSIRHELLKAIGESSIAIIVFSKNYASSSWCMDELVEIMKQQMEMKQIVYPVFYGVDPSEVRKQEGLFGEGFARHEWEKLKVWREVLVEAANLSGWDTKAIANGHEAECGTEEIQAIVVEGLYNGELLNFTHAFKNMTNLRLLHLDTKGMHFIGPEYLPSSLQYFNWKNYSTNVLPTNFGSGNLVGLHMHSSSTVELWKGVKHLHNLKFLDYQESKKLIKAPNFTQVPNLERLDLSGCSSLVKVHDSIGTLEKLKILDLSNCYELKSFPANIMMKSLETLSFKHCYKLRKFPEIQGKMERLSHIYLHLTTIKQLPESIVNLPNLSVLTLFECVNLTSLPHSICMLQNLTSLDVKRSVKLTTLPKDLGNIGSLEHLLVSTMTQLPSSVINLKNLKTFSAAEPPSPSLLSQKSVLGWFFKQKNTKNIPSKNMNISLHEVLSYLSSLTSLTRLGLYNLQEGIILPVDISTLSSLEYLTLRNSQFTRVPFSISQFSVLKRLDVSNCPRLEELPDLPPTVAVLFANNCKSLRAITGLSSAHGLLRQVSFLGCWRLEVCDTLTATVLQTTIQGYDVVKQQTTVLLPGFEIPNWFQSETTGIGQTVIKLPENWHNVIMGIALCIVADLMGLTRPISLTLSTEHIPSKNMNGMYHAESLHLWMEYVSFDLLQHSYEGILRNDWITITPSLILTISIETSGVKICGVRFVYKDVNLEENGIRCVMKKQENLLRCFRETKFNGITYSLLPRVSYIPEGDATFEKLSWNEKHEYYRSVNSVIIAVVLRLAPSRRRFVFAVHYCGSTNRGAKYRNFDQRIAVNDDRKLQRGKSSRPELLNAIGESSIAIIVFSKNYASSSWCMDELVEIMKPQKEMKQIVYPVFYGVDPSEVRKHEGLFGERFARHTNGKS